MSSALPSTVSTMDSREVPYAPIGAQPPGSDAVVCGMGVRGRGSISVASRRLDQLMDLEWQAWREIRDQNILYASPFFSPEFARCIHEVRGDVEVAVLRRGGQVVGLLPHHRIGKVAYPVGRFFNDAHNILQADGESIEWGDILAKLSLRSFDAHAMVGSDSGLVEAYRLQTIASFAANLGDDSRGYLRKLEAQHFTIKRQPQKTRKLAREVGEVRLEIDCRSPDILAKAIRWKRNQYARTHILDLFSPNWTRNLVSRMHEKHRSARCFRDADLSGLCSVLWAGGQPVAAHFGMIERGHLHYWFPAYDPAYARYSPGTALFRHMVDAASCHGIQSIDMGYGEQPYKQKQTDTISHVAAGCISRCKFHRSVRWIQDAASAIAQRVPMKETAKRIVRGIKPDAGISKLG